jgi:predicted anti-sigma-YlaC factor YlaD
MNHQTYGQWLQYAKDEIDEETRVQYENHLYSCGHCLELYTKAVEEAEYPSVSAGFADTVMERISETKETPRKTGHPNIRKQTLWHYGLAAAMTVLLMSTGAFSQFIQFASTLESSAARQETSLVDSFLQNTDSITHKIETTLEEGNKDE